MRTRIHLLFEMLMYWYENMPLLFLNALATMSRSKKLWKPKGSCNLNSSKIWSDLSHLLEISDLHQGETIYSLYWSHLVWICIHAAAKIWMPLTRRGPKAPSGCGIRCGMCTKSSFLKYILHSEMHLAPSLQDKGLRPLSGLSQVRLWPGRGDPCREQG